MTAFANLATACRSVACLLVLMLLALPGMAETKSANLDTHEYTLGNGLRLIVRENHRAPVAVVQVWYRVGGSDESPGETGLSHMLEHLMFKATRNLESGQLSQLVTDAGGKHNAFTTSDCTAYYEVLGTANLELALQLEAERMTGLLFDPEEFARELDVVKEERRLRVEDNPNALFGERFRATAYAASPYSRPVIGWMHDLERMTLEDTRDWYQQFYRPDNALVVIAGDVDPGQVLDLVQTYFGPLAPGGQTRQLQPLEVAAPGKRKLDMALPVQLPGLTMAWNVPSATTAESIEDAWALAMLAGILDAGFSARVERELVRGSEVALQAGVSYSPFARGDTLFYFSGTPNQQLGESLQSLQQAFEAQIARLRSEPVSEEEMERVRTQLIANLVFHQDSLQAQASMIGSLECKGMPWSLADQQIAALQFIDAEQVLSVAQRLLVPERLTVGYMRVRQDAAP